VIFAPVNVRTPRNTSGIEHVRRLNPVELGVDIASVFHAGVGIVHVDAC
jgi:hypothetical protein